MTVPPMLRVGSSVESLDGAEPRGPWKRRAASRFGRPIGVRGAIA
jgi:hypothetical protein